MHLLVLSAFRHEVRDAILSPLLRVSMHLLVLDDYRLTSPQAAPQRRLFDGNRHGRFTRPDSSANTMSIRPCSCRIPPLNGHASPTVQAPLSAPVFTGPRRQASCCRNFPSIRACTVAPSQITSKRVQTMFPRIEAKSIRRKTQEAPQGKHSTARHPTVPTTDYHLPDPAFPRSCLCVMDAGRLWTKSSAAVVSLPAIGNWQPQSEERMRLMRRPISEAHVEGDIQSAALSSAITESFHTRVAKLQIMNREGSQAKDAGFPVSGRRRTTRPTALSV